jgi:hypothetical protein
MGSASSNIEIVSKGPCNAMAIKHGTIFKRMTSN